MAYQSSRRTLQARRTRLRIIEAATAAFLERGYAGATIRSIAAAARVAVPTVELGFRTKAGLLKAAIDIAIAGDDEPAAVLDRDWTATALAAGTVEGFLTVVAEVVTDAQHRASGLVLAVFEGARTDPDLVELAAQLVEQRAGTAAWLVDALARFAPLRHRRDEAVEDLWLLMDPALFERFVRNDFGRRDRSAAYARWFARSARHLLIAEETPP